ncbi:MULTISPECIES: transporter associated domain-containing protein [Halocynthiibacter]|uniref:CBS domain-containing protein n=1 Tax=Halocynthiibacter halioticoli TaxID=2986804 RepID=A0AAE3LR93_9RHOB|nr:MULTISPECIES: transporter associated domain-containing protein [Halocynthiibacter]MCV6825327.1 CBS domain-containing protein [Halocynthiibacter halioticoli]MCW4058328.1 CBS domain-containing protein [Halocynthiibacter sp. SDUM655004]MDE0588651.1 CBS domain-containing protein [Halocynthiibacter sp. C4]
MGDTNQVAETTDGSSRAAHSAQPEDIPPESRGFFSRIVGALSPTEDTPKSPEIVNAPVTPAVPVGNMHNLRHLKLEDVAIPTVEIVAVPKDIEKEALVHLFRESGLTRLPVFEGTLDTPIGLIHLKDLALRHGFNGDQSKEFSIEKLIRPLIFAPPSMPIGVLLQKMQAERRHMALIIDEYGGVDGLVTIEDLIEQVIGEIEDEHDIEEDTLWIKEKSGSYLAQARTPLDEFEKELGVDLQAIAEDDEVDTLGGLAFVLCGRVPTRGEVVVHPAGVEFEIVDADPRRIKRMRVRKVDPISE